MLEIFQYDFMVRAFITGIVLSLIAPVIGAFLVMRRFSLLTDTLAHVSLVGVAVGIITKINPLISSIVITSIAAFMLDRVRQKRNIFNESILSLFLSASLATAVVLTSLTKVQNVNLMSYLFGSITTVSQMDMYTVVILGGVVLAAIGLFYKGLFVTSFDQEYATVVGIPVSFLNAILIIMAAITVTLSIQIIGTLLIGALMVIPVITVMQHTQSFKQTIISATLLSVVTMVVGLFASYYLNTPSGATVVLLLTAAFVGSYALKQS